MTVRFAIFRFTLFIYLTGLLSSFAVAQQPVSNESTFRFAIAGHVYGAPGVINDPFHPPFMQLMENYSDSLDLLILTGDIVQESDEKSCNKVNEYLPTLPFPTLIAPGNHDLKNRALFEQHFGSSNYFLEFGDHLLLICDLLPSGWNLPDSLLNEIIRKVELRPRASVWIISHHVFWTSENHPELIPNSNYGRNDEQDFYSRVLPELQQLSCPVYAIAGDIGAIPTSPSLHGMQSKNVLLIASGMGKGDFENILLFEIGGRYVSGEVLFLSDGRREKLSKFLTPLHTNDENR